MLVDGGAQQTSFGSHFSLSTLSGLINSSSSGLGNENLIFDIDPTNPVFLVVTTVLAMTLLSIWRLGYNIIRRRRRKSLQSAADPRGSRAAGVGGVGGDDGVGERSIRTPTRLGVVTRAGGRRGARLVVEKVTGSAEEQARLCEVLYDVYDGQVPAGGINSKDVRSCGLTVSCVWCVECYCSTDCRDCGAIVFGGRGICHSAVTDFHQIVPGTHSDIDYQHIYRL